MSRAASCKASRAPEWTGDPQIIERNRAKRATQKENTKDKKNGGGGWCMDDDGNHNAHREAAARRPRAAVVVLCGVVVGGGRLAPHLLNARDQSHL